MHRKYIFLLLLLFSLPSYLLAQGTIRGKVTDAQSGEPLVGANVVVVGTSSGATTDINGVYSIGNLNPATYQLKATYIGYQAITISNVRVSQGLTTETNFQLPAEGVEVSTVEVVAQRPLVNKTNTNAVHVTTTEDIEALPVRGVNNILSLTAGVVNQDNQIYIRGGRLDEVGYYLEGVPINNPVTGGRAVTISQDALEEIQVQSGGYTAEFGNANAGIVRQQLKTGPRELKASFEYVTDNLGFKGKSSAFDGKKTLGAYRYGYNEMIGTIGGPVFSERFRFFGLVDYLYLRDANPQPYPGINLTINDPKADSLTLNYPAGPIYGNSSETYTFSGTFTMDFRPILIRLAGTYSDNTSFNAFNTHRNAGNIANIFNTARIEQNDFTDGSGAIKLTHVVTPEIFYEINAGYFRQTVDVFDPYLKDNIAGYGDSVANAQAGFVWQRDPGPNHGQYLRPDRMTLFNFSFNAPGDVLAGYQKARRENISLTGALTIQPGKVHSLKVGGEYQRYTIRNYSFNNERAFSLAKQIADNNALPEGERRTLEQVYIGQGVNAYGFDALGNEYNGGGIFAPKHPVFAAAYVQDRIEFTDLILNLGLRFDYINVDNKELIDPTRPELTFNYNTGEVYESGLVDVPTYTGVSPRIGLSFPATETTIFHTQFGKFVQQTRLADIYQGLTSTSDQLRGGLFINLPVGFNIRPTRTTQYEIGFTQQIGDFASFDITGYYRDIKDQVVFDLQPTAKGSPFKSYNTYRNGDFATTKGLELTFNMRRTQRFLVNATLSIQDARGTGSFPNSNRGIVGAPIDGTTIFRPQYISPLEYNRPLSGNVSVDYRFGADESGIPGFLSEFGASLLMTFRSGHPFTRGTGGADLEGDARDRRPLEPLNASSTPPSFQVDLKVDKTFRLMDKVGINLYLFVINLFNRKNVENVFLRTGSATDNGYLSDPKLVGDLINRPGYAQLYKAINLDYYEQYQNAAGLLTVPYLFGPPRQLRLGLRLEY